MGFLTIIVINTLLLNLKKFQMESQEGISVGGKDEISGSHLQSPTQPSETVEQQVGTLIDFFKV